MLNIQFSIIQINILIRKCYFSSSAVWSKLLVENDYQHLVAQMGNFIFCHVRVVLRNGRKQQMV
jgi:hypothetical protein